MFGVFDNGGPADSTGLPQLQGIECWAVSVFNTFEEAQEYAHHWCGQYLAAEEKLQVDIPHDYSGYGDMIEIRKLPIQ